MCFCQVELLTYIRSPFVTDNGDQAPGHLMAPEPHIDSSDLSCLDPSV